MDLKGYKPLPPLTLWVDALRSKGYNPTDAKALRKKRRITIDGVELVSGDNVMAHDSGKTMYIQDWAYSPMGVLCDLYLNYVPLSYRSKWRCAWKGQYFRWMVRGKWSRQKSRHQMPTPIYEWWSKHHRKLKIEPLRPFLKDKDLRFDMFADLLELHAPWSMDPALLGYEADRPKPLPFSTLPLDRHIRGPRFRCLEKPEGVEE